MIKKKKKPVYHAGCHRSDDQHDSRCDCRIIVRNALFSLDVRGRLIQSTIQIFRL